MLEVGVVEHGLSSETVSYRIPISVQEWLIELVISISQQPRLRRRNTPLFMGIHYGVLTIQLGCV